MFEWANNNPGFAFLSLLCLLWSMEIMLRLWLNRSKCCTHCDGCACHKEPEFDDEESEGDK